MTATVSIPSAKDINAESVSLYGYDVTKIGATEAYNLALRIHNRTGGGFQVWKRVDNMLRKVGSSLPYPAYGSPMFPAR